MAPIFRQGHTSPFLPLSQPINKSAQGLSYNENTTRYKLSELKTSYGEQIKPKI